MANKDTLRDPDYLGDGVYCGHDGYQVWVWTSNGVEESAPVALDPNVLLTLNRYAQRVGVSRG